MLSIVRDNESLQNNIVILQAPKKTHELIDYSVLDAEEKMMFRLRVKEIARAKGISQRKLFMRSEVDIRTVRRLFQHPDQSVTVQTLARLAVVLDVDVSELIESVPPGKKFQGTLPDVDISISNEPDESDSKEE